MEMKCITATKQAERVIEDENKRRQGQKSKFVNTPDEFIKYKYSSVESVMAVMEAEECMRQWKLQQLAALNRCLDGSLNICFR